MRLCPSCEAGRCGSCPSFTLQHAPGRSWLILPSWCECSCTKINPNQLQLFAR